MKQLTLILLLLFLISCQKNTRQIDHIIEREYTSIKEDKDPNLNGFTKLYYPTNKIKSEGHFSNGIKNGFWKYYFNNGNVKKEGNYSNNIKDGFWKTYHDNGKVESEGHYTNNKPYGFWKYYNKDHSKTEIANL